MPAAAAAPPPMRSRVFEPPFFSGSGAGVESSATGSGSAGSTGGAATGATGDGSATPSATASSRAASKNSRILGGNSPSSSCISVSVFRASRNCAFAFCSWLNPRYAMDRYT